MTQPHSSRRTASGRLATLAVAALLAAGPIHSQAIQPEPCSNATFQGLYALSVEGTLLMPEGSPPALFSVAGLMQADGAGKLTVFRQITNVGGAVLPIDWAAAAQPAVEYSVNSDCTATIAFFVPEESGIPVVPPGGLPFGASLVLADGGREAIGIQTSPPNAVFNVRLKRTDDLDKQLRADVQALRVEAAETKALLGRVATRLGLRP